MPVTPEQIIKEGCWTPEMKDLIEYFKLKEKARRKIQNPAESRENGDGPLN